MRLTLAILLFLAVPAFAQMVEVDDNNTTNVESTGRGRAQEYFKDRQKGEDTSRRASTGNESGAMPRYLAIHLGSFFNSKSYEWGEGNGDDPGRFNMGVTYRIGEWVNSMDMALRVDYTSFRLHEYDESKTELLEEDARKLSFGFLLTFPDANSRFPLYFGAGLGAGFMMKQLKDESALVLDYSLVAGARFLDVIDNVGFMVETGLKNHLHLLSSGQFNGVFINVGTVFAF